MPVRPISGAVIDPIPRYRAYDGPALLSAGFRPFFLAAAIWAAIAVPLWLSAYVGGMDLPSGLPPIIWHAHEMIYGFASATAAGFMLTMIPNWSGKMPLQGWPLATLVLLWLIGRAGVFFSAAIGAPAAAAADLCFPVLFLLAMSREVLAGRNWRNLPMLAALASLLFGNVLVHGDAMGLTQTAPLGNRIGIATFLMLIALIGGRIIPSFTRNWLVRMRPRTAVPAAPGWFDRLALGITALALVGWVVAPDSVVAAAASLAAGALLVLRLWRWRGRKAWSEPLLVVLHLGYAWLAVGLCLLGLSGLVGSPPPSSALHALTAGAIGTMTLAVMTRTSLSQTGRRAVPVRGTSAIYVLITAAAVARVLAPMLGGEMDPLLSLAGIAWCAAFGWFALLYGRVLATGRPTRRASPGRHGVSSSAPGTG